MRSGGSRRLDVQHYRCQVRLRSSLRPCTIADGCIYSDGITMGTDGQSSYVDLLLRDNFDDVAVAGGD